jgi:DNA-binding SARP family transcriptional activator
MLFIEALIALRQGDRARAHARLREALVLTQGADRLVFTRWYRYTLSHLLPLAFEAGVEIETARKLVSELAIAPSEPYIEAWPWKVRVYSLGRFEVVVDGAPLNFSRKAPKKPIALLKVLVTCGARNVPLDRIVDQLWDDDEADSGRDACWLALHRLRKLLGSPEAVQLIEGNVSLDPSLVWVDSQAFEYFLTTHANGTARDESVQHALALYRGDFLAEESNAAWAVSLRERLRARFVREVELLGRQMEEAERWDQATDWYLRGLDADPLAEAFYQGLMRCYRAQGRMAEAMSAYRRLRQVLSVTLGMGPSPATESIAPHRRAGV